MEILCLNCGNINDNNDICTVCSFATEPDYYSKLINYSSRAVKYGYLYRIKFENQINEYKEIRIKYSLIQPNNYYELLALTVLGGIIGNLAYDLVKSVALKIQNKLVIKQKTTKLNDQEQELLELVSKNSNLILFITYIQSYYKGMSKIDDKVRRAIDEEDIIHSMLENDSNYYEKMEKMNNDGVEMQEIFKRLLIEAAKMTGKKRNNKPKVSELKSLLKSLKQQIKDEKKKNRKRYK